MKASSEFTGCVTHPPILCYVYFLSLFSTTIDITTHAACNYVLLPRTLQAYRDVLLSSVFTLCPTGHSPETFRLFEAAEAGSIPIVHYAMPPPSSSSSSSSSSIGGSGSSSRGTASTSSSDLLKTTKSSSSSKKKSASAQVAQVAASSKCQDPWRPFIESGENRTVMQR